MAASVPEIVFAFPPATGNFGSFGSHLGVSYLRAALAKKGIASCQYLNAKPGNVTAVARELLAFRSKVIGFTAYDANFHLCIALARAIKELKPDVAVVFGGPSVTFNARELLARHNAIDLCVLGETEETGPEIIQHLLDGHLPQNDWPGVAFRRECEIVCTPSVPLVGMMQADPRSALDVAPSPYLTGMLPDGRAGLLTGRGCTHQCQYCCFAALGRRTLRLHSIDRVIAELEWISAQQLRTGVHHPVGVQDDAFTLLPPRAKEICQEIISRKLKLVLSCVTRADTVDDELLKLMWGAGFRSIAFGLESAVPSVLRATGKVRPPDWPDKDLSPERDFVDRVRRSVTSASRMGFQVGVSIILGLPTETAEDAAATMRFVKSLPLNYYMHNLLSVLPGTPLWSTHESYGINCTLDHAGIPETTAWAHDVFSVPPERKCDMESQAELIRDIVADEMFDCRATESSDESVTTVILRADELAHEAADWLCRILAVGGTVMQIYRSRNAHLREQMFRDRGTITDHSVPARFYLQIEARRFRDGGVRHLINAEPIDLYLKHKPGMVSIDCSETDAPLLRWMRQDFQKCDLCELSAETLGSSDLRILKRRKEADAKALHNIPPPPRFRYPGRWIKDDTFCQQLTRLEIDSKGEVRTCAFGIPIGRIGDSKQSLLRRLMEAIRAAERRRKCRACEVRECPRCPFPGVDDETYCKLVKSSLPLASTLTHMRAYSRLVSTIVRQQDRIG